tara:strand:+ start:1013 stop:1975 length:963 start_codon:yes stop_codon:yes gene_type:complete
MSVIAYIETNNGEAKKSAFEVISFAKNISDQLSAELIVVAVNIKNTNEISNYGPDKIIVVNNNTIKNFNPKIHAEIIYQIATKNSSNHVVLGGGADSKFLAPILSVKLDAGYVSNVVGEPSNYEPFIVKRTSFSNKSFCDVSISSKNKIISISSNSFEKKKIPSNPEVIEFNSEIPESKITQDSVDLAKGNVSIADADIVVSAGRGMKGPENWHIIENLANTLNAATACSKPVSDLGWRPHSEHVGQTGKPVSTNLYIAIGISGAIQHLAGVSSSKVKVVINNDPEAPFFKAADYGIVGDAFEVVPKLNEKLKAFKAENN